MRTLINALGICMFALMAIIFLFPSSQPISGLLLMLVCFSGSMLWLAEWRTNKRRALQLTELQHQYDWIALDNSHPETLTMKDCKISNDRGLIGGVTREYSTNEADTGVTTATGQRIGQVEINWQRAIAVGWLIAWRGTLGGSAIGFAVGFVVGLIFGFVGSVSGWSQKEIASVIKTFTLLLVLPASFFWFIVVVKMALSKKYSHFRIELISQD